MRDIVVLGSCAMATNPTQIQSAQDECQPGPTTAHTDPERRGTFETWKRAYLEKRLPSPDVQQMLDLFGFHPYPNGMVVIDKGPEAVYVLNDNDNLNGNYYSVLQIRIPKRVMIPNVALRGDKPWELLKHAMESVLAAACGEGELAGVCPEVSSVMYAVTEILYALENNSRKALHTLLVPNEQTKNEVVAALESFRPGLDVSIMICDINDTIVGLAAPEDVGGWCLFENFFTPWEVSYLRCGVWVYSAGVCGRKVAKRRQAA